MKMMLDELRHLLELRVISRATTKLVVFIKEVGRIAKIGDQARLKLRSEHPSIVTRTITPVV